MTGFPANVPWPVAVLTTEPAVTSAAVVVYVAVQVMVPPGDSVGPAGCVQVTVWPWAAILSSVTENGPIRITLPVLVSVYVYVTATPLER